MPSVRAAMGLPSGPPKAALTANAETMSEQSAEHQQVPQSISVSGQTCEGTPNGQPISTIGNLPRGQPVDMQKLLTVSPAVQAMAAKASNASAVIVKVFQLTVLTHPLCWHATYCISIDPAAAFEVSCLSNEMWIASNTE